MEKPQEGRQCDLTYTLGKTKLRTSSSMQARRTIFTHMKRTSQFLHQIIWTDEKENTTYSEDLLKKNGSVCIHHRNYSFSWMPVVIPHATSEPLTLRGYSAGNNVTCKL